MSNFREDYSARIKTQLDEFNAQIDELEEKIKDAKEEARATYRIELAKLRLQSDQVAGTLEKVRAETYSNWDDMVHEVDKVRNAFSHAIKDFKAHL